ncbi:hypothetical protein WA158_007762 [Blastocystis sp. Blastoise]
MNNSPSSSDPIDSSVIPIETADKQQDMKDPQVSETVSIEMKTVVTAEMKEDALVNKNESLTPSTTRTTQKDSEKNIEQSQKSNKGLERAKFLGSAPLVSTVWKLTYPDFIAKIVTASFSFADTIYISNLAGDTAEERSLALGSVTISLPIEQALQMGLALLFGSGFSSTLGRFLGAHNKNSAEQTLGNLYFLDILCGILYPLIIIPLLPYILQLLGASEEAGTLEIGRQYIMIYSLGSILTNFMIGNNNLIRAEGQSLYSASTMIVGGVFNILLDPVFIAVLSLGVNGAAICTLVGNLISVLLGFAYYASSKSVVKFHWNNLSPNCSIIKDGLSVGVSGFIMTASTSIVSIVFNRLMIHFSPYSPDSIQTTELVSVLGALSKIYYFFFMPLLSLSHGILPILAFCKGANIQQRFMNSLKVCLISAFIVSLILLIIGESCAELLAKLFSSSQTFIDTFSYSLRFMIMLSPLSSVFFSVLPALQATKQGLFAGILAFCKNCFFLILYGILFCYCRGDYWGIFYAYPVSDITNCIISIIVYFVKRNTFVVSPIKKETHSS